MSPLSQAGLLLPLFEAIRDHLGPCEHATLKVTTHGSPCIEVRTERGAAIVSINEDGMCTFDTAGGLYTCDPKNDRRADVYDVIREALNAAREEWS
jgi:hypothetical protein